MIIISDPTLANTINNPSIRSLVSIRFAQILIGEPCEYNQHGYMIVVEEGDSIADLEERDCCFEMLFIFNDDGFAITLFISKHFAINITVTVFTMH